MEIPNTRPDSEMKAPVVFVISPEWTLRTMVRAELREAGVEALGMEAARDVLDAMRRGGFPSVIVIDGVELEKAGTRRILENLPRNIPIVVVDSRITPAPALPFAEILRRPVRVQDIVERVLTKLGRKIA